MTAAIQVTDRAAAEALGILRLLLSDYHPRNFTLRFWDGTEWPAETEPARFVLTLNHPDALPRMFADPSSDRAMAEAYLHGDFDVEGDLEAMVPVAYDLLNRDWSVAARLRLGWKLHSLSSHRPPPSGRGPARLTGKVHSPERDRSAVTFHYDVSNDFYALWLDARMIYSCAYFETGDDDLATAQTRKLDYLCRKLRLRPGERLLDIGCGWGGLILHAAQHFGVEALGITLSERQATLARERIAHAGLDDRCRVEVRDYREVDAALPFDKVVSVGMVEHVGEALLPTYFEKAWRVLRPGGVFLCHGIACYTTQPQPASPTFSEHYVFPDGELVPLHVLLRHAEVAGFEVRDVESLREHYVLTLRHWRSRLEAHQSEALQFVDQLTYRVWRVFLAGAAYRLSANLANVYQTLLVKPDHGQSGLPLTRVDWYAPHTGEPKRASSVR